MTTIELFLAIAAMFFTLFVIDIPLVALASKHGSKRQSFGIRLSAALFASACGICLLATLGVYLG